MKSNRIILFIFLLVFASCSKNKTLVNMNVKRTPVQTVSEGYFYFLPRTVIAVDVAITKTIFQPGPFAQEAESLLGLVNVIKSPSSVYSISEINIQSYAEPDPEQLYFFEIDNKDPDLYITLSETGLIQSVNKPFDSGEFMKSIGESKEFGHFGSEATFNYFIDINLQERIDTILERVRLDTMTIERQTLRRSWVEKSSAVKAKEVADHILDIREKKYEIIHGFAEINYSKEAIEYMYRELMRKENDYLALFTGISSSSTIRYRYNYTPDRTVQDGRHILFHFSSREGATEQTGPGSIPVIIQAKRHPSSLMVSNKMLRMQDTRPLNTGIYYRIPEYSSVIVSEGNRPRAEARMLVNQFGHVTTLPPFVTEVEFYPNTGSIKSVGVISDEEE